MTDYAALIDDEEAPKKPGNANPYASVIDAEESNAQTRRQQNVLKSVDGNAEQYALAREIEKHLQIPAPVAERNLPEAQRKYKISQLDHVLRNNPNYARAMENEDFAKLSADHAQQAADILNGAGTLKEVKRSRLEQMGDAVRGGFAQARQNVTIMARELGLYNGADAEFATRVAEQERVKQRFNAAPDVQAGLERISKAETMGDALMAILEEPLAVLDTTVRSIGASSPSLLLAAGGSIFGPAGTAAGAGLGSFAVEFSNTIGDVLQERGVDFRDPYALAQAFNDKDVMAAAREKAAKRGIAIGAFDAATAGVAGRLLAGAKPTVRSIAPRVSGELGIQAAGGMAGEASAQALTGEYKPGEILMEGFAELPTGIVEVRSNWRHARDNAMRTLVEDYSKANTATKTEGVLNGVIDAAAAAPITQRAPEVLAAAINDAMSEGVEVEQVYVSARQLATVFNQDPVKAAETLGIAPKELDQALASNGDIGVRVGDFVAAVAADEAMRPLVEHVRMGVGEMSAAEAREWETKQGDAFKAEAEKVLAKREQETAFSQSAQQVEDFVLGELQRTGRFTESVNKSDAALHKAFAVAMADRLGMLPMEFFQKHVLRVQGESVVGDQFDQSGKLVTDTPAFSNWFGESKVVDAEGKPLVVYHGTAADFSAFKHSRSDVGMHFGTVAQADDRLAYQRDLGVKTEEGMNLMPVYLAIRNPLRLPDLGAWNADTMDYALRDLFPNDKARINSLKTPKQIREYLKGKGYDGIVYKNTGEVGGSQPYRDAINTAKEAKAKVFPKGKSSFSVEDQKVPEYQAWTDAMKAYADYREANGEDSYIAFEPTQIKSAIGNNGQFNPNDPNILHQQSVDDFLAMFDEAATIELTDAKMSKEQIDEAERQFLSAFPEGTRYGRDTRLLKRVRRESDAALESLRGDPEVSREVASRLGPFSSYQSVAEILPPDSFNPNGSLRIAIFGKEQTDAGLVDEPALTITVTANGELTINGPEPGTDTFAEFKARGWADHAKGANGEVQQGWTALTNPENPGQPLPIKQLLPLLADTHARVREWRGEDYVGLHWTRATGALGGLFSQDESAVFFQSKDQQGDLVITHNLSADNLLHAVKMGGIPVPSLAVTKKDLPLTGFGEITLIGSKEMADPKGYAGTKVFGADIYSPRYPDITYKLDAKSQKKLSAALDKYSDATGVKYYDLDTIEREGARGLERDERVMAAFLDSKGIQFETSRRGVRPLPDALLPFANDTRFSHDLAADPEFIEAVWQAHTNELAQAYDGDRAAAEAEVAQERARAEQRGVSYLVRGKVRDIESYQRDLRDAGQVDTMQTKANMNTAIEQNDLGREFEAFTKDLLASLEPDEKIFQGFTNSGNRRYIDHTLENVVKILKKELRGGEGFGYGLGNVRAHYTPQFKSIEQIRKSKDRLIGKTEFEAVKDELETEFFALSDKLAPYHPISGEFRFGDTMTYMLADVGKLGVNRALKENGFKDVPEEVKQDVAEFVGKLSTLPTEYFEAKILRDVDLTEFSGAVVPEGVDQKVIDALHARGVKDVRTYKKGDEADRAAKIGEFEHLFFQNKDANRGSFNPDTNTIALLQNADLSTFLHESGHYFLEVMASVASQPDAPASVRQDFETLLGWFNVPATPEMSAFDTWSMMTLEEKRQYHEQFARGFESYLMEGKAPSIELQGLFARFRAWLINVYKSLAQLNVELTDEVRGVMDRLVATDEQIATAEAARRFAPIFQTPDVAGMTADEWDAYQSEHQNATDTAAAELESRSIRDMRWLSNAKSKRMKELQRTAKALRAEVEMGVRAEVMSQPVYQAWQFLTGKSTKSTPAPKVDPKELNPTTDSLFAAIAKLGGIDKLEIVQTWGTDPADIKAMPRPVFGMPVVRTNDGRSIDDLAQRLGEYGYLSTDENGKVDVRDLEDAFASEMRGHPVYSVQKDYAADLAPAQHFDLENYPHGKLDRAAVALLYGKDHPVVQHLDALKMLTSRDGYDPDFVADQFGFSSGDEMMRTLAAADTPKDAIEGMTDQRMLENYGDLSSPEAVERAAEKAIHNDVRARFLTRELNALRKATGKANVLLKAARQHAEARIASLKVRDAVKSAPHRAAEARSGKAAEEAFKGGDLEVAAIHKRDQLLNHELARAALAAQDEVQSAVAYFKKFDRAATRKALAGGYLDQIDQLLERFDFRKATLRDVEKRASLAKWLAEQEALGLDPVIDSRLVEEAQRQHYTTLTMEELRGLIDTVKSIEHLGRLKNKLLTSKAKRDLNAAAADVTASIIDNANREVKGVNRITPLEKGAGLLKGFSAMHRKFASIAREMDGNKDGGAVWEYFVRTMNDAGDREVAMRGAMSEKFADLFAGLKGINLRQKVAIPELNTSLRREEMLAIALNSGNSGNVQRLLDGGINDQLRGISPQQLMTVLNKLTDAEWDFVEGVWTMIESNRPAIAAQEKALTGVEPKWIEPEPFTLESGRVIRGGYYPAKYNADFSTRSNELEAITDLREQMRGAGGRASARNSYTKERAEAVAGRPLRLDLGVIAQHINEVTHRLAWQQWLIDARRLLAHPSVDRAVRDHYGSEILGEMKKQLADIAAGDNGPTDALDKVMNHIRNGTTIAGMGWNIMTSLMQPIGLTQSVQRVGFGWIGKGLAQFVAAPFERTAEIHERSSFMRDRAKTINREINDVLNRIRDERMSKVEASYFYLIQKFQQMVDVPTWLGAYEKAIAEGNAEDRAVALADQAVLDSQGGGQLKDLARVQRGGAGQKLFTNFYSFFNTTYNLAVESGRATDFGNPLQVGKLVANYLLLFTLPAVWGFALKEALRGDDDEDDFDKVAKRLAIEQVNYLLGTMVLAREIGSAVTGFNGYQGPAGTRFFSEVGKLVKQTGQGDVDMALVKAAANTVGIAAHLPSGQVMKSVEGTVAVMDGKAGPHAVLVGPPLKN